MYHRTGSTWLDSCAARGLIHVQHIGGLAILGLGNGFVSTLPRGRGDVSIHANHEWWTEEVEIEAVGVSRITTSSSWG